MKSLVVVALLIGLGSSRNLRAQDDDPVKVKADALQGNAAAQFSLGLMYDNGQGVAQDYAEALKWYRKAADQGNARAQRSLGLMYFLGRGVPQDHVQAYVWLSLAVAGSNGDDHKRAAEARDRVAAKLTPAQVERGQRIASEFKPK